MVNVNVERTLTAFITLTGYDLYTRLSSNSFEKCRQQYKVYWRLANFNIFPVKINGLIIARLKVTEYKMK